MGILFQNGLAIGAVPNVGPSFTITSSDITFNQVQYNSARYSGETSAGFTSLGGSGGLFNGVNYSISGTTLSQVNAILSDNPFLNINYDAYAWNASWTSGGNGVVRMSFNYGSVNSLTVAPIDTTYPNWQTSLEGDVPLQIGLFTFPATFTLYSPLTNLVTGGNGWC